MIKVFLIGRLTQDPRSGEANGRPYASFGIAANSAFKKPNTTNEYEVDFVDATAWGALSNGCSKLTKGQLVGITGDQHMEEFTRKDGTKDKKIKVRIDSIQFLSPPPNRDNNNNNNAPEPEPEAEPLF